MGLRKIARPQREYSEEEKQEIKNMWKNSQNIREKQRLLCVKLRVSDRKSEKEIAEITGFTPGSIRVFISKYHQRGAYSLLNKPQHGNHRSLSKEEEQEVLGGFSELAEKGQMLIVSDFHKALEQKAGHAVALTTAYNILKRHKWRKIMPRSRHPKKASDSEIEDYKKNH
jgi:transposase